MQHRRLAPRIPRRARRIATKRRNAARHHHLALHARHRAPLDARPSEPPAHGLLVALVQQLQEREQRKVRARDVDVERLGHLVHRRLDEELLAELSERQGRVPPVGGRADDARVGDDEVEEARVRGDVVDGGLERGLGGHVALEGDEDGRVRGGGGFEDGEAPAEEVDFAGAVHGEGARHGEADSWGGVSGWEGGGRGRGVVPLPPPVTTATMPSTRKREAASRVEAMVLLVVTVPMVGLSEGLGAGSWAEGEIC